MPAPASFIPSTSDFVVPQGLNISRTPQGGTAYTDSGGNTYLKQTGGYSLAPASLPSAGAGMTAPSTDTTPVQPANPTEPAPGAGVIGAPSMPPSVKTALETTANSSAPSQNVPMSPSQSQSSPIDYSLHAGETVDQYNARIESARSSQSTQPNTPPTPSKPNINDFLSTIPARPTPIDSNAVQMQANAQPGGVNDIQNNVNTLETQLSQMQADALKNESAVANRPGVVESVINGQVRMVDAQSAYAMKQLQGQITAAKAQLTQATNAVKTFMTNNATDFKTAEAQYQFEYTKAMSQYTDAVTQQDKEQASARANATVTINSFKGSQAGTNSITPDQKTEWNALELQAGLPSGTIQSAVENQMNITKFIKGSDGNEYVTGIDANGVPYTAKIGYVGGTTKTGTIKEDISSMSNELSSVAGKDGYISPANWQKALSAWTKAGYSSTSFVTNFKAYANPADIYTGIAKYKAPTATTSGGVTP